MLIRSAVASVAALVVMTSLVPARAQSAPSVPVAAASAPAARDAGPRLMTPEEKRDSAAPTVTLPLEPDRPATPQLTIPLGRKPAATPRLQFAAPRRGLAASAGGVGDAAARCEAQSDKLSREACLDRVAREQKAL